MTERAEVLFSLRCEKLALLAVASVSHSSRRFFRPKKKKSISHRRGSRTCSVDLKIGTPTKRYMRGGEHVLRSAVGMNWVQLVHIISSPSRLPTSTVHPSTSSSPITAVPSVPRSLFLSVVVETGGCAIWKMCERRRCREEERHRRGAAPAVHPCQRRARVP